MKCHRSWAPDGKREKCSLCGTKFPCPLSCTHVDCLLEKGQPLPDWILLVKEDKNENDA